MKLVVRWKILRGDPRWHMRRGIEAVDLKIEKLNCGQVKRDVITYAEGIYDTIRTQPLGANGPTAIDGAKSPFPGVSVVAIKYIAPSKQSSSALRHPSISPKKSRHWHSPEYRSGFIGACTVLPE